MTVMLRDGYFRPLTKTGTDWYDLLGEEYFAVLMEDDTNSRRCTLRIRAAISGKNGEIDQSSLRRKQRWTTGAARHLSVIVKAVTRRSGPLAVLVAPPKDSAMVSPVARRAASTSNRAG